MAFRAVLREEDLWSGEKVGVEIEGKRILLVNVDGAVRAFDDRCAHQGWPLSRGKLVGRQLTCALHQWCYDVGTGLGINPHGVKLRSYGVRIMAGDIQVDLDGS